MRLLATVLFVGFVVSVVVVVWFAPARAVSETDVSAKTGMSADHQSAARYGLHTGRASVSLTAPRLYRGRPATYWAAMYRERTRQLQQARRALHRRWAPTVDYALRLSSAVFGVSYWQLRSVAWCESRHNPFATNGRYLGLFQLSWDPFGFSPFDPVASALSTAATVSREGWAQWACSP